MWNILFILIKCTNMNSCITSGFMTAHGFLSNVMKYQWVFANAVENTVSSYSKWQMKMVTHGQVFAWLPDNLHYKSLSYDEIWKKGWL